MRGSTVLLICMMIGLDNLCWFTYLGHCMLTLEALLQEADVVVVKGSIV